MFWTFKLSFDEDIWGFFWLGNCFGYFSKNWVIYSQTSGRPVQWPLFFDIGQKKRDKNKMF